MELMNILFTRAIFVMLFHRYLQYPNSTYTIQDFSKGRRVLLAIHPPPPSLSYITLLPQQNQVIEYKINKVCQLMGRLQYKNNSLRRPHVITPWKTLQLPQLNRKKSTKSSLPDQNPFVNAHHPSLSIVVQSYIAHFPQRKGGLPLPLQFPIQIPS